MVETGWAIYLPLTDGAGEGSEPGEMVLSQVLSMLFHRFFITGAAPPENSPFLRNYALGGSLVPPASLGFQE